jgi:hypothetical protein
LENVKSFSPRELQKRTYISSPITDDDDDAAAAADDDDNDDDDDEQAVAEN